MYRRIAWFVLLLAALAHGRTYLAGPMQDEKVVDRIRLPDTAASFAGMIRGVVVEKRDGQFVFKVGKVLKEWKHSRAKDAEDMIGKNVLVAAGKSDLIRRFLTKLERGEEITLDVANKEGETLTILELTEDQRERAKQ